MTHDDNAAWRRILAAGSTSRAFIGEIARLYAIWVEHGCEPIQEETLAYWCRHTAARTSAQPDPILGLQAAEMLGIVERDEASRIVFAHELSQPSHLHGDLLERTPTDLALAILERMAATPPLSSYVLSAIDRVTVAQGQLRVQWDQLSGESRRNVAWLWMQQLGLARFQGQVLELDQQLLPFVVAGTLSYQRHISEEEMQARLAEQSRRALLAEEYVVRVEQQRLTALGCLEYADGVQRVSKYDVAAGYDILSFTAQGDPQYIEVKSSVGRRSLFVFTRNEMRFASENRAMYWLAWVEFSARLPERPSPVYWFQDPISILEMTDSPWSCRAGDVTIEIARNDHQFQSTPS